MTYQPWRTRLLHFLAKPKTLLLVWILLATFSWMKQYGRGSYNNYKIFKGVFWHTLSEKPLYEEYPDEYFDTNHYGPFFSVLIAPFAVLPNWLGLLLWNLFNVLLLYYAIFKIPIDSQQKVVIGWLSTNELWTSLVNQQSNPLIAASILLSFSFIIKKKDLYAIGYIVAGTLMKLYSIVGLTFFFFSKRKVLFILFGLGWLLLLFVLPMLLSSTNHILHSYQDWFASLSSKDVQNQTSIYQDISLIGLVRRASGYHSLSPLYCIIPGGLFFLWGYLKSNYFTMPGYQLLVLIATMIGVNIFSTGSESSTYIISFVAISLWFTMHKRPYPKVVLYLMVFAFILTSLSPTDLIPSDVRLFIRQYSLKALPCAIIWFYVVWQMITYNKQNSLREEFQVTK
jgi:hypothetical protein